MPATSGTAVLTLPSDTEILMVREFDAPKHLVYHAYTTPELVKRWWAGANGTVTVAEIDLRVGGAWRYAMTTQDGYEVAFHGTYREIVPNERIVNTEIFEGAPEAGSVVTATFAEADGRTTLSLLTQVDTKEIRDTILATGMEGGAQSSLDALEQVAIELA